MDPHKEWIKETFDRTAKAYGEEECSFFSYFGERLVSQVDLAKGDKVLDIATGRGAVLSPAAKIVGPEGSAIGIDLSPKMIEDTKRKNDLPWIELKQMDAEHLLFPDNFFDVVFCAFALFFFPNLSGALSECKRVLKPGGKLAVSIWGQRTELEGWIAKRAKELGASRTFRTRVLDNGELLKEELSGVDFVNIQVHKEVKIFVHKSAESWWESLWAHGTRGMLEQLSPQHLDILHKEVLKKVASESKDGQVSQEKIVFYAIATKN